MNATRNAACLMAALACAAAVALAVQNRALRASLARAETEVADLKAAAAEKSSRPGTPAVATAAAPQSAPTASPAAAPDADTAERDRASFEKAVEERAAARADEIVRERHEEREARRREWENATDEEREARRREFQKRMQEHATAQLAKFEADAALDDTQCAAFEMELEAFDSRVKDIAERYAVMIDGGVPLDFEMQLRMMNEMSSVALDAYTGLDEVLPEGWRKAGDGSFNVMFGISPSSLEPIFDAIQRSSGTSGLHGPGGPFGGFPGGGRRRRGGNRVGNGGGNGGQ